MTQLIKEGLLARVEIINISNQPQIAEQFNIRSVPYTRIGDIAFEGVKNIMEIKQLIEQSVSIEGITSHLHQQLADGDLAMVEKTVMQKPEYLSYLLPLLDKQETAMQVRVGIGAILETMATDSDLNYLLPSLIQLSRSESTATRSDATYYLSLLQSTEARKYIRERLNDADPGVREIAQESLPPDSA